MTPEILITAAQAYPAFERLVLAAKSRVRLAFRIFDPFTRLRSDEGKAVGLDWFDLLTDAMARGVELDVYLSDFDPIARPELHRASWRSARAFIAAAEASGRPERLNIRVSYHPARVGALPKALFWPRIWMELRSALRKVDAMKEAVRKDAWRDMPGLRARACGELGRLRAGLWPPAPLIPASHHQKIAVVDDMAVYLGGLDLDERRWDGPEHDRPSAETWHDVQLIIREPQVIADAHRHLDTFGEIVAGRQPAGDGGRILRTLSAPAANALSMSPRVVADELRKAHVGGIEGARDLIYLETQFLRDRRLASTLAVVGRENKSLGLIAVVPAAPEDIAFGISSDADSYFGEFLQARAIDRVAKAFGRRALFLAPAAARDASPDEPKRARLYGAPIIYVHAKVSVFDAKSAIVSSANLNGRSLSWDTEAGIRLSDPEHASLLEKRLMRHWMGEDGVRREGETGLELVARWRDRISHDCHRPPSERQGLLLPYPLRRARESGMFLPGIPEEMV